MHTETLSVTGSLSVFLDQVVKPSKTYIFGVCAVRVKLEDASAGSLHSFQVRGNYIVDSAPASSIGIRLADFGEWSQLDRHGQGLRLAESPHGGDDPHRDSHDGSTSYQR